MLDGDGMEVSGVELSRGIKLIYIINTTLYMVAWGVFFTFTTKYISIELGGGVNALILFTSLNWFFTLSGFAAGKVAGKFGERNSILLGSLASIPTLTCILIKNPYVVSIIAASTSLPWVLAWSVIVKSFFTQGRGRYGSEYGKYTVGTGLGFFIGSVSTGFLYYIGGATTIFIVCSIMLTASPLIYYIKHQVESLNSIGEASVSIRRVVVKLRFALISLMFVVFGRELLYSIAPVKLSLNIDQVLPGIPDWLSYTVYGVIYSGGALFSPIARLIAGKLVDKFGSLRIYSLTALSYILLYWFFVKSEGLYPILIWQIPLYPFLDLSFNVYVAEKLPRNELVSGFGATMAFTALGGILLLPLLVLGYVNQDLFGALITVLNIIAIALALLNEKGEKRGLG